MITSTSRRGDRGERKGCGKTLRLVVATFLALAVYTPNAHAQAPTDEMAVTPPSIRKSAPTTYAESSDAR
jgi:hypothetical protein